MTLRARYHEVTTEDGVPVLRVLTKARAGSWSLNDGELAFFKTDHGADALVEFRCDRTDFAVTIKASQVPRGFKRPQWNYRTLNKADLRKVAGVARKED